MLNMTTAAFTMYGKAAILYVYGFQQVTVTTLSRDDRLVSLHFRVCVWTTTRFPSRWFWMSCKKQYFAVKLISGRFSYHKQRWHSGGITHLPPMWPGFDSSLMPYVGWVCWFFPCSEGFFQAPVFLLPQKPTSTNSNSTKKEVSCVNKLRLMVRTSW